jgi:putative tryptophan/tyrosine transport system substrate-binding protein
VARAQPRQLPLVGILAPDRPPLAGYDAFLESLRGLGQIEGSTHVRETRWAEGQRIDLYRQYAKEFVGRGAHVNVTGDTPGTIAAHDVSKTTPIVMAFLGAGDPIELGFATSLARPGGNVTGIYSQTDVLAGKRLQILRETLPTANRVAVLHVSVETARRAALAHGAPAKALGLEIQSIEVSKPEDFDAGFGAAKQWQANAVLLTQSAVFHRNMALLAETAMRHRMPTLSGETGFAAGGGLMNQGPDIAEAWRRSATFVDKILKGAALGDLPIEQPTVFKLVVNLKTAKALGLEVPASLLAHADEVIE